jgi:hypothetical protein
VIERGGKTSVNPDEGDLELTAGWGHAGKWLSYREKELLGRSLSVDEARYVTETARRIAALILLGPGLDDNYRMAVKEATNGEWGPPRRQSEKS